MQKIFLFKAIGLSMLAAGAFSAQAADGKFYDPSNKASPSGNTAGFELFGTIGCPGKGLLDSPCPIPPKDSDGDGVIDSKDRCPNTLPGMKVNAEGCEPDNDQDGVVDRLDKCPGTQVGRKVNADGCELDSDGDGVVDGQDRCPDTPRGRKVSVNGCELDSDGDGIVDALDKCPTVHAKTADGCPAPVVQPPAAPAKMVLDGVNFGNNKATLVPEATAILDRAAESLKQWGDVKVEVAGHTDDRNSDAYNKQLSQRRAEAVRDYLVSKGVDASRLTAKGYGESSPVAANDSEENRFKNRRVELVPLK